MATPRFDQDPEAGYGRCLGCNTEFATEALAQQHMDDTLEEARAHGGNSSHQVSVLNPSREARIRSHVGRIVGGAIEEAMSDLTGLTDDGDVTEEEMTAAIGRWPDFADAWQDALVESRG